MILLYSNLLWAHETQSKAPTEYHFFLGYQYRSPMETENFQHPHCSVIQYNVTFPINTQNYLGSFADVGISLVGLNQSIIQPAVQGTLGFQFGEYFRFGTGPIITLHSAQDSPFVPQLIIESTLIIKADESSIPLRISYVPLATGPEQYQLLIGYSFQFQ